MKYHVSCDHGAIPWMTITPQTPADQQFLRQLEIDLVANKARFNSQGCGGKLDYVAIHLQENAANDFILNSEL